MAGAAPIATYLGDLRMELEIGVIEWVHSISSAKERGRMRARNEIGMRQGIQYGLFSHVAVRLEVSDRLRILLELLNHR